jgi:hypothetical protein
MRARSPAPLLALALSAWACSPRPVPYLEHRMSTFDQRYEAAREIAELPAKLDAYRSLRADLVAFRASLGDEQELDPEARVHASSDYGGGIGWVQIERRDVDSIRQRSDRLLRSLDRFLAAHAAVSVPSASSSPAHE